jgi:hypothetical protein
VQKAKKLIKERFMKFVLALLAVFSATANATIILCDAGTVGGCGGSGDVENVLMPDVGDTGFLLTGETNITHTLIDFESTEQMVITGGGQAKLAAVDGNLGDVTFQAQDDLIGFDKVQFNVHAAADSFITLIATDMDGMVFDFSPQVADGSGNNWFTLFAIDEQRIDSVYIAGIGITDIDELQQVRLDPNAGGGGGGGGTSVSVPEPGGLLLLGLGLVGLRMSRKRNVG